MSKDLGRFVGGLGQLRDVWPLGFLDSGASWPSQDFKSAKHYDSGENAETGLSGFRGEKALKEGGTKINGQNAKTTIVYAFCRS